MNIEIKRKLSGPDKSDDLKWDLQMKSTYRSMIFSFLIGIVLVAIYIYDESFTIGETVGSIFIILSIITLINIFKARNTYKDSFKRRQKLPFDGDMELTMIIEDAAFKCETFEMKQEFKWSIFYYYKYIDNVIFLLTSDHYLSSYTIYKNELTEQQFSELFTFLAQRLPEKK